MSTTSRLAGVLLVTSALTAPGLAFAQDGTAPAPAPTAGDEVAEPAPDVLTDTAPAAEEDDVEISVGGGSEIIVTGRRERNFERSSAQVISVLSSAEIARTGDGNIAGALGRVTGLSVVGSGFVYVRGLGDRYSLALLNGSPLPSPEPLKRVVPLDLFPSGVIASSLVQKTYSANYPGEFGGGVINLTTKATPNDPFLTVGVGISGDTETTFNLGYGYRGGSRDWLGYDDGTRNPPPALAAYLNSGLLIGTDPVNSTAIARELVNFNNGVVQSTTKQEPNISANLSGGKTWPVGDGDLGLIFAAGYSNKFNTRSIISQSSLNADLSSLESDFRNVVTDQRTLINGLLGIGFEQGDSKVRLTGVYIHDTIKKAGLALGQRPAQNGTTDFLQQRTAFFARQLIDTQFVAELKPADDVSLDVRLSYANSKRNAPSDLFVEYVRTNSASDPFGGQFVNALTGNRGTAEITYSNLDEDLFAASTDLTWRLAPAFSLTGGAAYTDTRRFNSRRKFIFRSNGAALGIPAINSGIGLLRPDLLLAPNVVDFLGVTLIEDDPGSPAFDALLEIKAGYLKGNATFGAFSLDAGVRYEDAVQTTAAVKVFQSVNSNIPSTSLNNSYWLPAATLTWDLGNSMQARLNASKTIARPQFRELISQPYFDPDNNRAYRGNPLLQDSQLYNAEARFEWYFAPEQRVSLAGFYKKIDNPIEAFVGGGNLLTSYANAPEATLYGAELEAVKYWPLESWGGSFFDGRRLVTIGNYTFTKSKIKVQPGDTVAVFGAGSTQATDYFVDGSPLTGQSDHVANVQLGLEDTDRLSQQTILLSYASERVVSRGFNGTPPQPDVIEKPGIQLDFVWREGFALFGTELEAKFEARNILGRGHEEFQQSGTNRIDVNTYDVGTTLAFSISAKL